MLTNIQYTMYNVHYTMYNVQWTLYILCKKLNRWIKNPLLKLKFPIKVFNFLTFQFNEIFLTQYYIALTNQLIV